MRIVLAVVVWIAVALPSAAAGQSDELPMVTADRETMRDITVMAVVVEDIGEPGFSKSELQTAVELKLRQNGIRVIDLPIGAPFLYVQPRVMKTSNGRSYIFRIDVEFQRLAQLLIGGDEVALKQAWGTFWRTGTAGIAGINDRAYLKDATEGLVDEFLNDYLAVNPVTRQ